ncbi:hypothetical protein B0T21DRAFT_353701 [Apiosordaria backusii]|uniref:Uncharacterized protein n=1 Tax=Apiosordaria backusii TaxID=314023 RepID=A0AA39ZPZ1_9PEZI|nr:hypothetical protein B0T21DRAFT_353701 [Apiosordaria backusii]
MTSLTTSISCASSASINQALLPEGSSQDPAIENELAELFRIDENVLLDQNVTPSPMDNPVHRPVKSPPYSSAYCETTHRGPQSAEGLVSHPDTPFQGIDEPPLRDSSLSERISSTLIDDCGTHMTARSCRGTDSIDDSADDTATVFLEEQNHKREDDSSLLAVISEPLECRSTATTGSPEPMLTPSDTGPGSRKRQADVGADSSKPRLKKRRCRDVSRTGNSKEIFVTLSDATDRDGFIKDSYPLHIDRLEMYPDPETSFMIGAAKRCTTIDLSQSRTLILVNLPIITVFTRDNGEPLPIGYILIGPDGIRAPHGTRVVTVLI